MDYEAESKHRTRLRPAVAGLRRGRHRTSNVEHRMGQRPDHWKICLGETPRAQAGLALHAGRTRYPELNFVGKLPTITRWQRALPQSKSAVQRAKNRIRRLQRLWPEASR